MRKLTQEQLNKKIELHQKWLKKEKGGKCLELENCSLENLSIGNENERTNLCFARFKNVNFYQCKIHNVEFSYCLFLVCSFLKCLVSFSKFYNSRVGIHVQDSRFEIILWICTDMTSSVFSNTKMNQNKFSSVNLNDIQFNFTDFADSLIAVDTSIYSTNFYRCSNMPEIIQHQICPSRGSFIGWKKVRDNNNQEFLLKLEIPEDAKRSSATTRKCRCSKAKVLGIYKPSMPLEQISLTKIIHQCYYEENDEFVYKVGEIAIPDSFDEDEWNECSNGIHFFITPEEAINY